MKPQVLEQINIPSFESMVGNINYLHTQENLHTMQINLGRLCNLSCKHCHMAAGPNRTEIMRRPVMEACLSVLRHNHFDTVDITGGAPEMNPNFRWFVREAVKLVENVIVRTNLVILLEPEHEDIARLYRDLKLEVVCSLPCYTDVVTDEVRGNNVFARSIEALRRLNTLGYGILQELPLNLAFNPSGASLPPRQQDLEKEFRKNLFRAYGVRFTSLIAIINSPVGRFAEFLSSAGILDGYMGTLYSTFNAETLEAMMCRGQVSVAYDGRLYDCDFNQAAGLPLISGESIFDWQSKLIEARQIRFGQHCFACTAGQGSGCGGAIGEVS